MNKVITKDAEMFIESLFEVQPVKMRKFSTSKLKFTGEKYLNKEGHEGDYRVFIYTHFIKFYKKYSRNFNFEEFTSVYSVALTEACAALGDRFPDFSVFVNDKKTQMETMKYLKLNIEHSLYRQNNPDSVQTRQGDKNIFVHAEVGSIEKIQEAYAANDNEFELSEANRLFGTNIDEQDYYQFTYYLQHFLENKGRVLTAKQLAFYEAVKEAYVPKNSHITKKEALKEVGYTPAQFHKFTQNIAKRMEEDFKKYGKKRATNEEYREKLYKVLNNFIKVADSDENVRNMQLNLTMIVRDNYEREDFEEIILEGLNTEEKVEIVRSVKGKHYISNKVLYKVYNNILTYLEDNELIEVEASEAKSTYNESIVGDTNEDASHYYINANGSVVAKSFEDIVEEGEAYAS